MDISTLLPHFKTIVDVVKENNSSLSLNNNFEGVETIDPSELMIQTWREALSSHPEVSELKEIEDDITSKLIQMELQQMVQKLLKPLKVN